GGDRVVRPLLRNSVLVVALIGLPVAALPLAAPAQAAGKFTLRVSAAASLADAFGEIARTYEKRHAGSSVQLNLAGSQQLVAQIVQGSSAGVFAFADERWMTYARQHGLLAGPL